MVLATPLAAQEPNRPDAAKKAEDLQYSVRVRGDKETGKSKRLIIELTVVNESSRDITLDFANSGRVCGELYDADHNRYARFPEVTLQVVGTEAFPPKKKRVFQTEVPLGSVDKISPGRHSATAWLCGYGIQRAWAGFPLSIPRE